MEPSADAIGIYYKLDSAPRLRRASSGPTDLEAQLRLVSTLQVIDHHGVTVQPALWYY